VSEAQNRNDPVAAFHARPTSASSQRNLEPRVLERYQPGAALGLRFVPLLRFSSGSSRAEA
jgi:hypothetical protein